MGKVGKSTTQALRKAQLSRDSLKDLKTRQAKQKIAKLKNVVLNPNKIELGGEIKATVADIANTKKMTTVSMKIDDNYQCQLIFNKYGAEPDWDAVFLDREVNVLQLTKVRLQKEFGKYLNIGSIREVDRTEELMKSAEQMRAEQMRKAAKFQEVDRMSVAVAQRVAFLQSLLSKDKVASQ